MIVWMALVPEAMAVVRPSLRVAIQARKTATIAGSAGNVIADREAHQAANSRQSLDRRDGSPPPGSPT
jgi:hypothetical protein